MDCMNLPKDVLNRLERKWAARVSQRTFPVPNSGSAISRAAPEGLPTQKQPITVTTSAPQLELRGEVPQASCSVRVYHSSKKAKAATTKPTGASRACS
jgi:hypothetical protein